MFNDFVKYIDDNQLFRKNDNVLLAVSGGIDSMVMLSLFLKTGFKTGIAHCNFCLRSEESDKDEELVRDFASENKVRFHCERFKTKSYAKHNGISVQMAARELRYAWFESVRKENNYDWIAVAHNLNDNIETLLINLTRGTGITGLTGMKPVSNNIIRPLLFATRDRITDYAISNNIPYREDKSNAEIKYTRNRIRHLVIPVLKEINPSLEDTLNETILRLAGTDEIITMWIDELRKKISVEEEMATIFSVKKLRDHYSNTTILFELFRPYGITGGLIKDLINILKGNTGARIFTLSHRFLKNREDLIVTPLEMPHDFSYEIRRISDFTDFPGIISADIIGITSDFSIKKDKCVAILDFDTVKFPFKIRKWKKGDFFFPFGMKNKKKLSDYFIDSKFPVTKKEKALVLESEGKIVWIIGERIDDRFRIKESTKKVLRIEATTGK